MTLEEVLKLCKIGGDFIIKDVKSKAKLPKLQKSKSEKEILRSEIVAKRKDLTEEKVSDYSKRITDSIIKLDEYKKADIILVYMSVCKEVDLSGLIETSLENGKRVFIPKVISKKEMRFYPYDGHFTKGAFGILEPEHSDADIEYDPKLEYILDRNVATLMIMPGVAFDIERNRLGYGGGFYDRFLEARDRYEIRTIAVGYDIQIVDHVPTEENDIKPDMIITENRVIKEE